MAKLPSIGLFVVPQPPISMARFSGTNTSNQFNLMYVLTVIASCGGGKKAESRRRVSANALVLILLVG